MKTARRSVEKAESLEEAVKELFGLDMQGRLCILTKEAMTGRVAQLYNELGQTSRTDTYRKIVQDFKNRTGCYGANYPRTHMLVGTIVEVGSGSGLLTFELAAQTNGRIFGLDLSADMIQLAEQNLKKKSDEKKGYIKAFWKKIPWYCRPGADDHKKLDENPPFYDQVKFKQGSVYDLPELFRDVNYVVCRNALHRFQFPELAIQSMYSILAPRGQIYIRDLRRDADWNTIVKRIGEQRWQRPELAEDYIAAMAAMLTTDELEQILQQHSILDYTISNGSYLISESAEVPEQLNEYEADSEYVCIVKKTQN